LEANVSIWYYLHSPGTLVISRPVFRNTVFLYRPRSRQHLPSTLSGIELAFGLQWQQELLDQRESFALSSGPSSMTGYRLGRYPAFACVSIGRDLVAPGTEQRLGRLETLESWHESCTHPKHCRRGL
jgi:hypothetical protein